MSEDRIKDRAIHLTQRLRSAPLAGLDFGLVRQVNDQIIRAGLPHVGIGQQVEIVDPNLAVPMKAEVVGIDGGVAILSAFGRPDKIPSGARVVPTQHELSIDVGPHLLGHVLDGFGNPLDGNEMTGPNPADERRYPLRAHPDSPLDRPIITETLPTGLRVIDGLLTLGIGQRVGIFGPPGTGKTSLIGAIARNSAADVVVIGLVGERGREVREFIDRVLTKDMHNRIVIVAATSDRPAMERVYAASTATAIAEGFRAEGRSVLLIVDSLTRVARALREIGLAAGEPPTRRGFPASVYPALPALIERSGLTSQGSITAVYTLLVEGDGEGDPIAEEVRSLTDGHIVLSRKLAEAGHFPAIDVLASLSRVMRDIADPVHLALAYKMRGYLAKYQDIELLLQVGELKAGQDKAADAALAAQPDILDFCRQPDNDASSWKMTMAGLRGAMQ